MPSSRNRIFSSTELDNANNNNNNNRFLYYNNETDKIEGVSLQSSYTTFKLNPYRNVNVITSTNQIFADLSNNNPPEISKYHFMTTRKIDSNERITNADLFKSSQMVSLPLYHQFIYTIKFSNRILFKNERDLIDLLNDQSVESSKIRVGLIRRVAEQLGINASTLRLNWVEKFAKPTVNNNKTDDNSQEVATSNELESVLNMDYYNENTLEEPEFVADDLSDLKAKIAKSKINTQPRKGYFTVMISFSDIDLLDMQKSYFNLLKSSSTILNSHRARVNDLRNRFYLDCEEFFERIQEKHDYKFKLNVYNITKDQVINKNERFNRLEKLIKVQFLKLCDLNKLNKILVSFQQHTPNNNKQPNLDLNAKLELTNQIIKNSTQEILFNTIKLDETEDDNYNQTSQSKSAPRFSDEVILNNENVVESDSKIVKFKSESLSNETIPTVNSNLTPSNVTITSFRIDTSFFSKYFNKKKLAEIFWSIIPEEDLVLAVIVPITIIVSMLILTIVVSCLLHMCNKNYRQRSKVKKLNDSNLTMSNTNKINNIASPSKSSKHKTIGSSSPKSPFISNKSNPLYKQRPYLSKGVPVILYEEMSDKPIDDYDENNRNVIDSTGGSSSVGSSSHRTGGGYYRSPLILRNEKPPMPAPPEYSRQSYDYLPNKSSPIRPLNDKLILNELHSILQKDIQSVLTDSPDESALLIESSKKSGINTYYKSSSSSQSSPPSATDDNLLLIGNGIKNQQSSTLKEVTKRLHDSIGGVGETVLVKNGNQYVNNKPRHLQHNNLDRLIKP
jgi:hypothetical protein